MSAPRSLADDLRHRDEEAIARLLRLRPDLLHPVPADFTSLAARATAGPSASRSLDALDTISLHVLHIAAEMTVDQPRSLDEIIAAAADPLGSDAEGVCRQALEDLRDRALVWGHAEGLRAISTVAELVRHTPVPIWPIPGIEQAELLDQHSVDSIAGLHARETLSLVRDLLDDWSTDAPAVLRTGGLSLRDFAASREALHSDWGRAALTIELAHAARLLVDDEEEEPHWVPTDHFDAWTEMEPGQAWREIVDAWLHLPLLPSRSTAKTKLLAHDDERRGVIVLRREVLDLLNEVPPGGRLTEEQIRDALDARRPRRAGDLRRQVIAATLIEGEQLGVLGSGALSSAARYVLDNESTDPVIQRETGRELSRILSASMPADVDHVLIQADLTLIAPGPLAPTQARSLGLMADVESRGHATVYRISETSARRAFDAGWDAEGVLEFLRELSRTPVPQPLEYMIQDVARRHGAVRAGTALSYLRSDAADLLSAIVEDRRLRALGLHRIADTVVISQAPTSEVIAALRDAGYAPAAEAPGGGILVRRPTDRRAPTPRTARIASTRLPEGSLIAAAVKAIRAGDRAGGPRRATVSGPAAAVDVPRQQAPAIVSALKSAIDQTSPVWIGYADTDGTVVE